MTGDVEAVRSAVITWFADHARALPWRDAATTPWGVLVSEIMLQQTPAARVEAPWRDWMLRWPTPRDLAEAPMDEVLRAWGRLGYPRRALRLREAAATIVDLHGGVVPDDESALLALPGVGAYTAAAVRAFAFGRRSLVLDVNVRRVLARVADGVEHPARHETAAERRAAMAWVPDGDAEAAAWSAAAMELGATVCTARSPECRACPVAGQCAWLAAGRPAWQGPARVAQPWEGTDRQCRGRIMGALRGSREPVPLAEFAWSDEDQLARCVASLVSDGLAVATPAGLSLPR
ncbi:adenine glycosylase [Tessaracoccus aquimaris]|uniref:Adenine DNA glycosylase n=1 Tax=Tessaracoccus aquimaris TaxID=1332264 RepID=A0A1Q2CQ13_9ACTN|nr:A/G-specific adenine glycosylase [Tessaracoccus aquimaris]AQP48193.1 adenine glycosylase [Tessaracoccus aquimaris]